MHKMGFPAGQTDHAELSFVQPTKLEPLSRGDNMSSNWMRLTHDAVMLGLEAQRVIGLRLMKLAGGGPAPRPRHRTWILKKPPRWRKQG